MLWDDLLNSLHRDWRGDGAIDDRLDNPDWLHRWLTSQNLNMDRPPEPAELQELKELRALLHRIVTQFVSKAMPHEADTEALNAIMAGGPVIRKLVSDEGRYRLEWYGLNRRWEQVLADIAASMAQSIANGETSRIRICDNPNCLWVYVDETRNRSKRYCDDKMCGNLMKVRRFRARQKAAADAPKHDHE
ncbi:CGNR zinc finger domain-containing protein [Paenibacillus sp. GCM10023248]|uniref:CGNR zinc finger domain-containing protein n=1 Tax=Bacillales TaxID=1385 RepID=UPI002377FB1D|nr:MULTISPECIES: ABATE domain-containing protein [Bacillales]MDD9268108.1 CGNR zinc finger domain-containing protein [Paenibacillus sp. MAHUQ-63]MDR6879786.1 putative RNA-binding Zn ribbon-like protein [Bacillus sp. 3255]